MSKSSKLKSERHHWWPETLSAHWADEGGCCHWLLPNGEVRRAPPKNFGVIGNGHHIKLASDPSESTAWDQSFESEFQIPDNNFGPLVAWLGELSRVEVRRAAHLEERFLEVAVTDEKISILVQCLVSLAIRSPMNREAAVGVAERLRGPLPERERNSLIGMNMLHCQRIAVRDIGTSGKFVVLYSDHREFIYGDGFYHNLRSPIHHLYSPKILVPLTPNISVLYARPTQYSVQPRLTTLVISADEADVLNNVVQVYARQALFYRAEKPSIQDEYRRSAHLVYSDSNNSVNKLIEAIPGVPRRGRWPNFPFA